MIREVGASIGRAVLDGIGRAASRLQESRSLSPDLLESDDAYLAVFDAPGVVAADVNVRFENNAVSVRIDRFREFHDGYEMVFPGRGLTLNGRAELPDGAAVDADRADATLTPSGTLEVLIPKANGDETGDVDSETQTETDPTIATEVKDDSDGSDSAVVPSEGEPDAR